MHDQVGVGDALVDGLDAADGQDVTSGLAAEFVGAVGGADGDGQGIDMGLVDKVGSLIGVGKQHVVGQRPFCPGAVFLARTHGFQRPQAANSPSTETPTAWASPTTCWVTRTL